MTPSHLNDAEERACSPVPVSRDLFNPTCYLPYGLSIDDLYRAMTDFTDFLGFVNQQLRSKQFPRLEAFLMPAGFSSLVGEFMNITLPKYCAGLVKNQFHNGHPDLIPTGMFPNNAIQYAHDGVEIKASRHSSGWQGHNPESIWLMVFHFESNSANDPNKGIVPKPFWFRGVYGARLDTEDWTFSGRSSTSRRTITASVNQAGAQKMKINWIYRDSRDRQA